MSARKRKHAIDAKQCSWARWWIGYEFGEEEDLESWLGENIITITRGSGVTVSANGMSIFSGDSISLTKEG